MDITAIIVKHIFIIGMAALVLKYSKIGKTIDFRLLLFALSPGKEDYWATQLNKTSTEFETKDTLWTPCSASCGHGVQKRICNRSEETCNEDETRACMEMFSPSYLSTPRIHFSGRFEADTSTINNIRCNYVNERFSTSSMKDGFPILSRKGKVYELGTTSWNPDGSGRFHISARVTSLCASPRNCSTNDEIVGREVKETSMVAMVDLDTDWQFASEIYGMRITIQGVLEAKYNTSTIQQPKPRGNFLMATIKSALTDINWIDEKYMRMFRNSTDLSISFMMDQYSAETYTGRITGTIGLTSSDDPLQTTATRRMYPAKSWRMKGSVPFHIDHKNKIATLDLSGALNCTEDGDFNTGVLGTLNLAMDIGQSDVYCRKHAGQECLESPSNTLIPLTTGGEISRRIGGDNTWYNTFGGMMDIDLKHLGQDIWKMLQKNKIVITSIPEGQSAPTVILSETEGGINIGVMDTIVKRLNPGEEYDTTAFVSSYGRPLPGAELDFGVVRGSFADIDCGWDICNRTLGEPRNALQITKSSRVTDSNGLIKFKVKASNPGDVRGCGLDGQIYPMEIRLKYENMSFVEGGLLRQLDEYSDFDYYLATLPSAIAVYSEAAQIECPTWQDLEDIFLRYHNLYPVMWKHGIIDLHSYKDVKERARMLRYSMFETDFNDSRFMPISRDLSKSKLKLIQNWMECGMKERDEPELPVCDEKKMEVQGRELETLLQRAVTLELTTIPPYYTAWLSLQTEFGRNKEIAKVLKSVFVDEMLHMALAANVLNSINGTVDLTDYNNLPSYPASLGFGDFYKIAPDLTITLGPMSRGLVNDVFLGIEEPAGTDQREILDQIAVLWEKIAMGKSTPTMQQFLDDSNTAQHNKGLSESELEQNGRTPLESQVYETREALQDEMNPFSTKSDNGEQIRESEHVNVNWKDVNTFAAHAILNMSNTAISSIGAFYTAIALNLAFLESCHQMKGGTVFTGDKHHQMNISHWYRRKDEHLQSSQEENVDFPIFAVNDLKTAFEAIVAIIHEGEGGSDCSPYLKDGENSEDLSHYYRYKEIVHGRKLTKVRDPSKWQASSCIRHGNNCESVDEGEKYCFVGDDVPFSEDGVWPIAENMKDSLYPEGSEVQRLSHEFNALYTRLLKCLETSFGGKPDEMKKCMSEMHYMTIIGKKLVKTPIRKFSNGCETESHGAPTWTYRRNVEENDGLPVIETFERLY